MDHLRTQELPEKLYRVQYDRSQSTFSYATLGADLQAKDTTAFYGLLQLGSIKTAVQNQFEWGHRGSQPFITVFSDKEYAMAWALLAPWNSNQKGSSYFELYTIDTTHLGPDTYVFKLSTLVEYLDVTLPVGPANHVKGGYLFLHRVPGSALVERQTREEIAEERDVLKRAKKEAKKEAEQAEFLKLIKELKLGEEAETLETRPAA